MAKRKCVSLHMTKRQSVVTGIANENERQGWNESVYNRKNCDGENHYDWSRHQLNFVVEKGKIIPLVNCKLDIVQRHQKRLKELGFKYSRKDGKSRPNTLMDFVLGGERETMRKIAFGNQSVNWNHLAKSNSAVVREKAIEQWAIDSYNFLANRYGADNIISFIVHLDETTPHAHAQVVPTAKVNIGGRPQKGQTAERHEKLKVSFDGVLGGMELGDYLQQLQDDYAATVGSKYGLQRGERWQDLTLEERKKRGHLNKKDYAAWQDHIKEMAELDKKITGKKEKLNELSKDQMIAERRIKGLTTMIHNLENKKSEIENELGMLQQDLDQGVIDAEEMSEKKIRLLQDLAKIQKQLEDKQQKLKDANMLLDKTAGKYAELLKKNDVLTEQLQKELPEAREKALQEIGATAYGQTVDKMADGLPELENFINTLPPEQRENINNVLDKMGIFEVAKMGNEMVALAAALSLGYVDQVTNYAESHGGGGGGDTSGWGRKKDEDDESWRRRCLENVASMFRSGAPKKARKTGGWHR